MGRGTLYARERAGRVSFGDKWCTVSGVSVGGAAEGLEADNVARVLKSSYGGGGASLSSFSRVLRLRSPPLLVLVYDGGSRSPVCGRAVGVLEIWQKGQ